MPDEGGRLDHRAAEVEQRPRILVVEEPFADTGQHVTVPLPPLKTARSGRTVAGQVAPRHRDRAVAAGLQARAGDAHPIALGVVRAEQHGDVVAALVGDQHVGYAVAVHVGHGDAGRGGADEVGLAATAQTRARRSSTDSVR